MELEYIQIRESEVEAIDTIFEVERKAFGSEVEAKLAVDLLTDRTAKPIISLLAFHKEKAVGHILFTRAYFDKEQEQPIMHILAPLAVIPEYQRKGIGKLLIEAGIQKLGEMGSNLVFVLGHKEYYPKHGFIQDAERLGYPAPYPILEKYRDCWMVQAIGPKGFGVGKGKIKCSDVMDKPEFWSDDESDRQ